MPRPALLLASALGYRHAVLPLLNIDLGESIDEDPSLVVSAHLANIACGGHAGDFASFAAVASRCVQHNVRVGAHPSYPDREHFGRRSLDLPPQTLTASLRAQLALARDAARAAGTSIHHVKPHGALYHDAQRDSALANALVTATLAECPGAALVGGLAAPHNATTLPSALRDACTRHHLAWLTEGFADRAYDDDGALRARALPGAILSDRAVIRAQTLALVANPACDTICIHGDHSDSGDTARLVRRLLDDLAATRVEPLGDDAVRVALPHGVARDAALHALRAVHAVRDVVIAETWAGAYFTTEPRDIPARALVAAVFAQGDAAAPTTHAIRVRYDGPDLVRVCDATSKSREEIIALHTARTYEAVAVGFAPGFAYLAELDPGLSVPRLDSPRPRVNVGSVAIAGLRTAVYPGGTAGGWNLIGTAFDFTPFDPLDGARIRPGDRVRFIACNDRGSDDAKC